MVEDSLERYSIAASGGMARVASLWVGPELEESG